MALNPSVSGSPELAARSFAGQKEIDWNRRFLILLCVATLFRLVYLLVSPLSLSSDEAYYWDWSRRLAWGYYSKPPMVAWIIGLFSRVFGAHTAAVRLPSVVLATISTVAVFVLARRMYDAKTAFWAAAVGMASPGAAALGYIMTIDAPLMCFWSLGLYFLWTGLEKKDGGLAEWFGLTVVVALGLLSKQVMAGFIVLMFVFVALSKEDRRLLKSPRLYLVSLLGLAALIPTVLWNARHGWITLYHTESHFAGSRAAFFSTFAQFLGGQLGVVSPITWLLLVILAVFLLLRLKSLDRRSLYLLSFSILPLSGIAALSLRQKIQPNWPAATYTAAMVLLAAWGCEQISAGGRLDPWRPYFKKGVVVGAAMALLTYGLPFWAPAIPGRWADKVAYKVEGWRHFGRETGRALEKTPRPQKTFILTFDRKIASELAFYIPWHPRVYVWRDPGEPRSQYDLWPGPKPGRDALIICPEGGRGILAASGAFQDVEPLSPVVGGQEHRKYRLYLGRGLKSWPGARL